MQTVSGKRPCTEGDEDCCTRDEPCDWGESDCDFDFQCRGDLVCGSSNCPRIHPRLAGYDCCMKSPAFNVSVYCRIFCRIIFVLIFSIISK